MPYRPPRVGQPQYDAAWRKQRLALLREQPLCRICLAAGRTVAAAVVDHIVPLNDGGTNTTANLQPLCKRCHDAIKTPADSKARAAQARTVLRVVVQSPRHTSLATATVDAIAMRATLATRLPIDDAHNLVAHAVEGMVRAWRAGLVTRDISILLDCPSDAQLLSSRYGALVEAVPCDEDEERHAAYNCPAILQRWYAERLAVVRALRLEHGRVGHQQSNTV